MKLLTLSELNMVSGCGGGVVISPPPPTRGDEKEKKITNADGSYKASTLPVETNTPDEG
ncbi:hypothetical protein AAEU28_09585 [Pseudoalteromonas sp. SS15]|uniref:hypothetical protein n=1 Tax=Pseudoalteromonas sp. SS15 TaxID=3139393 RepID=UPI003BAA2F5E